MKHSYSLIIIIILCSVFQGSFPVYAQSDQVKRLKDSLKIAGTDAERTNLYNKIINRFSDINHDSVVFYARQGLQLFTSHNYKRGQAWMVLALGNEDDNRGYSYSAAQQLLFANNLFNLENDKEGISKSSNILGVIEGKKGNYDKSLLYFLTAKNIYDSLKNLEGIFSSYINLGLLYDRMNDSAKALNYYLKADSISRQLPNSPNTIVSCNDLGSYYMDRRDTAQALSYFMHALELCSKTGYHENLIVTLMNISSFYYGSGNNERGKKCLDSALFIAREYHLLDLEGDILLDYVVNDTGIISGNAIAYLDSALGIVKITGNKYSEMEVYDAMSKIYERNKKFEEANKYLKLKHNLSDSLVGINKAREINNIQSVYELQKSNNKVNSLEQLTSRIRKQETVIITIAIMLVVLCIVLWIYFRKTNQLNVILQSGKKELTELNNMKDKIFSIIGHDMRAPIANITSLMEIIEQDVKLPDEYRDLLAQLKDHSNATLETLDNLVQLGKSLMKGKNYNPKNFNAKSDIHKCLDLKAFTAGKKNITISDQTMHEIWLYGDPVHFDFILRNLVSNALKFSYPGSSIEINAKDNGGGYIVFSVSDHGTGMSEKAKKEIFKASVTSTYGTQNEKGNGIGLMLCYEFAILNSGKIWVESKEGSGSTFYFIFKKGEKTS